MYYSTSVFYSIWYVCFWRWWFRRCFRHIQYAPAVTRLAGHLCDSTPTSGADGLLVDGFNTFWFYPLAWNDYPNMFKHIQTLTKWSTYLQMGMDQYLLIPFLVGWTSIYHLFWGSPGVQGFWHIPKWLSKHLQNYKTNTNDFMFIQFLHFSDIFQHLPFNQPQVGFLSPSSTGSLAFWASSCSVASRCCSAPWPWPSFPSGPVSSSPTSQGAQWQAGIDRDSLKML